MKSRINRQAFDLLKEMTFGKKINETVKRAIRMRLEVILQHEEEAYQRWKETIAHKLTPTRAAQVRREFEKRIKAYKITIYNLTPYFERTQEPNF